MGSSFRACSENRASGIESRNSPPFAALHIKKAFVPSGVRRESEFTSPASL